MLRIGVRIWVWLERCDAEVVFEVVFICRVLSVSSTAGRLAQW